MKKAFMVFLLTGFIFPLAAQEYKVCLSSVLKAESAEYLSKGFNADGIATVYEAAVVHGRLFIRILTAETYGSLPAAVRAKNALSRSTFILAQGIGDLWIRTYPAPWNASDFVSRQIPYLRQEEPVEAAASSPVPARDAPPSAPEAVPTSSVREAAPPPVKETPPDREPAPPPPEPAAPVREATPPPEAPPVASQPPVATESSTPPTVPAGAAEVTVKPEAAPQPPAPKPLPAPVPAKADIAAPESPAAPADLEPEELPAADAEVQPPAGPPSTDPDAVFAFHKDNFSAAYDFIQRFADSRDTEEAIAMAGSVPPFLSLVRHALEDFHAYLPTPLSDFEKTNADAKALRLASKVSFLETRYLARAEDKMESLKTDILSAMESDTQWLASENATIKYAPAALQRIEEHAETLASLVPEDEDLLEKAALLRMMARESYRTLSERIAENRLPSENYQGDNRDAWAADMKRLYEQAYSGQTVERVVLVDEDWREEASAEVRDGKIVAGVYKHLQAALAVRSPGAEVLTVYTIGFRRTWTGSSNNFGPAELYSIGSSYPILPEHLGE